MNRRLRLLLTAIAILSFSAVFSQTSLPLNTIATENFNSIGSSATATLPANWRLSPSGNAVGAYSAGVNTTTQAASSGLPATGGRYNWATTAGTDRAVGFLTAAAYNTPNAVMAYYRNTTGASVNSVTVAFAVERYVVNTGTFSLAFASSTDGTVWTAQTAGDIATGLFATGANAGTFGSPQTISRIVTVSVTVPNNGDIYFRWVFNTSNVTSQGLGLDDVSVFAGTATPVLTAKLRDILQVDNGAANQFNEGDVIRYQTVIKNTGTGNANNVQINIPPPSNTTLVGGSIKTSAVAVDDNYAASFNTTLNGSTVLANDFGVPLPTAVQTFGPVSNPAATVAGSAGTTNSGGALTVNVNGTFTYTSPTGFSGIDQFKYVTGNGNLPNNDGLVTITVGSDITFNTTNVDPACNGGSNGSITINASGGNGTLTYSITGAGGTYFASNVFTGLASGLYNLAVKDAGGYIKTGNTTLNNPAAIVVSGTIPTLTYNTAMATATFTRTGGTAPITWSATGFPTGISINSSTGDVTGTPTVTGSFSSIVTATDVNGCIGTLNVTVNVAPKLTNDAYNAVGNTQLVADGHSAPATPFTTSATNILTNDQSNAAITVTAGTFATTNGGSITIDAAGKFTYTPLNGSTTADSYTYTATSNTISATATINFTVANMIWFVNNTYAGANGAANGSSHRPYTTVNAAITPSLGNQYIYVHTGSGNTTGNALLKSGQTLRGAGAALSVGALTIAAGTKPMLTGTVTLANSVTVDGFDMTTATLPAITNAGLTVTGVTVNLGNISTTSGSGLSITGTGNNVTVTLASITTTSATNGINLTNTAGTVTINGGNMAGVVAGAPFTIVGGTVSVTYSGGLTQPAFAFMVSVTGGHNTGTITFQTGTLNATNGIGLQFDNADGIYNFNGTTTLNGGDASFGVMNGSSGTFNLNANTSITNPTGTGIDIRNSNANVTYSGSFSKTNTGSPDNMVFITGNTGGTITINGTGTKTASTATSNAINLVNNTGTTINISGNNLLLTTTTGVGFNATGGGTISVTGTGNIITSGTGTALNVANTSIGASGLSFQSISSAGGSATGIILDNTGTAGGNGGLTVNGDGTNTSLGGNSTGGTISGKSGADGSTTTGIGIYLNNTKDVVLRRITINGTNQNYGILGFSVVNFTLQYATVNGTNGTAATLAAPNNYGEGSIYFGNATVTGLTGTSTITNINISGGRARNFSVVNSSGTLDRITITGSTFGLNQNFSNAIQSLAMEARGSNAIIKATVGGPGLGNTFTGSPGDLANFTSQITCTMEAIFQNNTCSNSHAQNTTGGGGLTFAGFNFSFNCSNNTLRDANGSAITLQLGAPGVGSTAATSFNGTVNNNTIGVAGVVGSGSATGNGIFCSFADNATLPKGQAIVAITNNTIQRYNGNAGIYADNTGGSYDCNFTITNNTTLLPGAGAFAGLALAAGSPTSADDIDVCASVTGNNFSTGDPSNANDIILGGGASGASSIRLPGLVPATNPSQVQVQNYLLANNNVAGTVVSAYVDAPATFNTLFLGGAGCTPPSLRVASSTSANQGDLRNQNEINTINVIRLDNLPLSQGLRKFLKR